MSVTLPLIQLTIWQLNIFVKKNPPSPPCNRPAEFPTCWAEECEKLLADFEEKKKARNQEIDALDAKKKALDPWHNFSVVQSCANTLDVLTAQSSGFSGIWWAIYATTLICSSDCWASISASGSSGPFFSAMKPERNSGTLEPWNLLLVAKLDYLGSSGDCRHKWPFEEGQWYFCWVL